MNFEKVCEKLGFNPLIESYVYEICDCEDDSRPSPFSVLTDEEAEFLDQYIEKHRLL